MDTSVLALERAQIIFSVALGLVALLITFFAVYVAWSTMWGDRWYRKGPAAGDPGTSERAA
ncbi:MAG: hypothetical protein KDB10_18730 [Acidimicrobiales bacterium]|nr:hypothetical protein [Acidimicrobiales bacterium]